MATSKADVLGRMLFLYTISAPAKLVKSWNPLRSSATGHPTGPAFEGLLTYQSRPDTYSPSAGTAVSHDREIMLDKVIRYSALRKCPVEDQVQSSSESSVC